jgi:putative peptidoglycan lipid II flippase
VGLRGPLGHVGISVAVAGSSAVQMVLLLAGLKRRMGSLEGATLARSAARTVAASVLASAAGWGAAVALAPEAGEGVAVLREHIVAGVLGGPPNGFARALPGLGGLAAFGLVFALAAWGLRSPELDEIARAVSRRVRRGRPPA